MIERLMEDGTFSPRIVPRESKRCRDNFEIVSEEINSAIVRGERVVRISTGQLKFRKHITRGEQVGRILRKLILLGYAPTFHGGAKLPSPIMKIFW
jgi:hypothetical protein